MKKELKIGIFVISVLVVSFFVINYLRGEDIFNREYELTSRFENVEGLVASAPVYIKGYKAGKVTEVSYDSEKGDFTVLCSISKEFAVPSDSRMVIYSTDIMGGKGVKIDFGSSASFAQDGDTLAPVFEPGMMDALAASVVPLVEKVSGTIDSLNVTVALVNRLLSEENQAHLSRTLMHAEKTMASLRSLSASIDGKSAEINSLIDNLDQFTGKLGAIADKVDITMTGVNEIVGSVSAADINALVSSAYELLRNINDPNGSVGKLLNNDSVYNSVDSLLVDVNEIVDKIKENPKKYLKISVF